MLSYIDRFAHFVGNDFIVLLSEPVWTKTIWETWRPLIIAVQKWLKLVGQIPGFNLTSSGKWIPGFYICFVLLVPGRWSLVSSHATWKQVNLFQDNFQFHWVRFGHHDGDKFLRKLWVRGWGGGSVSRRGLKSLQKITCSSFQKAWKLLRFVPMVVGGIGSVSNHNFLFLLGVEAGYLVFIPSKGLWYGTVLWLAASKFCLYFRLCR